MAAYNVNGTSITNFAEFCGNPAYAVNIPFKVNGSNIAILSKNYTGDIPHVKPSDFGYKYNNVDISNFTQALGYAPTSNQLCVFAAGSEVTLTRGVDLPEFIRRVAFMMWAGGGGGGGGGGMDKYTEHHPVNGSRTLVAMGGGGGGGGGGAYIWGWIDLGQSITIKVGSGGGGGSYGTSYDVFSGQHAQYGYPGDPGTYSSISSGGNFVRTEGGLGGGGGYIGVQIDYGPLWSSGAPGGNSGSYSQSGSVGTIAPTQQDMSQTYPSDNTARGGHGGRGGHEGYYSSWTGESSGSSGSSGGSSNNFNLANGTFLGTTPGAAGSGSGPWNQKGGGGGGAGSAGSGGLGGGGNINRDAGLDGVNGGGGGGGLGVSGKGGKGGDGLVVLYY